MRNKFVLLAIVALFVCSCKPMKQYPYFQDWKNAQGDTISDGNDLVFKKKDKLKVIVLCEDLELSHQFNLTLTPNSYGGGTYGLNGHHYYHVDMDGNIEMPTLGKIHVEGMTREELVNYVQDKLKSEGLIRDPVVIVEFVDMKVTLLGEIKSGNYELTKDKTTVLEVLAAAGDLDALARRPDILLIRQENGVENFYTLNMDSIQVLQKSPAYFVQQNDVIYVQPTRRRTRDTIVNGNNILSVSFYTSLGSFLMTLFLFFRDKI